MSFAHYFHSITGNKPFPWQSCLYEKFSNGEFPNTASIPTGLGKTSIVAIWLIALALHPEQTPRRLVYVVNRRTVVDQTTDEVKNIRTALIEKPELNEIKDKLLNLCALPLPSPDAPPLAISTLRGQFADNREWSADPSRPAVIIGTVDMIGSGLLFSRYTVSFKLRPHHAAFLAQDALLVHDEAHLEPAFQKLLNSIVAEQARSNDPRKLCVIELTATTRSNGSIEPFKISGEDIKNEFVKKRLNAIKKLSFFALDEGEKERDKITELALAQKESGRVVLVFVRSVEDATKIAADLEKKIGTNKVLTLTGTMRGRERDELVAQPLFRRFLSKDKQGTAVEGTVFLVATSAGEVGINISADDLICDLSTYESMAQRFGRVNRFGEHNDSTITVVYPTEFSHTKKICEAEKAVAEGKKDAEKKLQAVKDKESIGIARERTLTLLQKLGKEASPAALERLPATERAAAFSPQPQMRDATAIQFDAWALTSIRKPIVARPPVVPYLHGEAEWQPPETQVAWRKELDVICGEVLRTAYPPEDLLEDFPLKPHELLRDTSKRIAETLSARIEAFFHEPAEDIKPKELRPAWLVHEDGSVDPFKLLESAQLISAYRKKKDRNDKEKDAIKGHKKDLEILLANTTLILPASLGGIDEQGLFTFHAKSSDDKTDVSAIENTRFRLYGSSPDMPAEYAAGYRIVRAIDTETGMDEPASSSERYWLWLEAKKSVNSVKRSAVQPETLVAHSAAVVANLAAIAGKLFPVTLKAGEPNIPACLLAAGKWHDMGKDRRPWQQGIGNTAYDPSKPETILAKSGASMRSRNLAENYRHEFGSIHTVMACNAGVQAAAILDPFSEIERDIILHLIAAHHGRARPHFPIEEVLDFEVLPDDNVKLATEVPRRFARLQQRFGRWGLAWLESMLRAADYSASAGIVADRAVAASPQQTTPHSKTIIEQANRKTITLRVNVANPGQYFACCGLFELASCIAPDVLAHFEQDENKEWRFVMTAETIEQSNQEFTLYALFEAFTTAKLTAAYDQTSVEEDNDETDVDDASDTGSGLTDAKAPPLKLGSPFDFRLDWWETATKQTAALKVWAGSMDCLRIARAMKDAVGKIMQSECSARGKDILFDSRVVYEHKKGKPKKVEPFYFDAKRGPNADSRDVGFSPNSLKFETIATPAVEILCLIGLQRAIPIPAKQPRQFVYHLWTQPLPIALLAAALNGLLTDSSSLAYRFESWFRTSQRKHKAFLAARRIVSG